jgi:hypothetical protein
VQNRFAALDRRTAFNNKLMFIYMLSLGVTVFAVTLILNSINPNSVGSLLILTCVMVNAGLLIIKRLYYFDTHTARDYCWRTLS